MPEIGFALSSEEHPPNDLVRFAKLAEEAGFTYGLISDHFHPWTSSQGESAFVWASLGGIAQATERIRMGTGVTCPMIRTHPAIVAHAAATVAAMMPGRFFLGLGTGENLNEHVTGARWPAGDERLEMLEEAIEVIRLLWQGGQQSHRGKHYTVEDATLYTLPDELPPIVVAAAKPGAARLAARNDGFIGVSPEAELVQTFEEAGGGGKPRYGQVTCCWGESEEQAKQLAYEIWPNAAITGELSQELPNPEHFEQAAQMVTPDDVGEKIPCGPDVDRIRESIDEYADAGYDHVYIHQIGPDQEAFIRMAERELLPRYRS
ncbi:MAG: TIGR03557 family F420-dependent LLM class oxidoreductase [Actinomycetota bacterium]|nr:TIGR03557 family F420-dependent LLM class oxidoreductase [Actinomycetota bacterium]